MEILEEFQSHLISTNDSLRFLINVLNPLCTVTVDDSGNLCAQITNDLKKKVAKSRVQCVFLSELTFFTTFFLVAMSGLGI